jgi:pyruvate/2-oxoglutarate dehydrogenase complex dihydrolipoamide acyltransferase (E2) component
MYQAKKPPTEKETFTTKPKKAKSSSPKRKSKKEEEGVFTATEGKIKEGGLRKALKVDKDYKFSKSDLSPLLKHEDGKTFMFQGKKFKMTDNLKKKITLAINMLK